MSELERIKFAFNEIQFLTKYYNDSMLHDVALKIEILARIYTIGKSFYIRFITYPAAYNSRPGAANSKLWYTMYKKSFDHLKAIREVDSEESKHFRLSSMAYRRIYEKQREEEWSTVLWQRHLPLGILNMISEYVH